MSKRLIYILILPLLVACSSIALPDLGIKKVGKKTYEARQPTCLGKPVGKAFWVEIPSSSQELRKKIQAPAVWLLWLVLPLGIISLGAMMFVAASPGLMKLLGALSGTCLVSATLVVAWLLATQWPLLSLPIVIVVVWLAYRKTKGKKLKMSSLAL